ncbi:MAG: TIGR03619 family F420-dependent LLM class oxidoreductase [Actinomycetota bacterium]|nr:TIGR03619 family F420-dependent LLM class oxidoreductase [Actinomycetota bacterium]MDG1490046.1 TIGR03619 family F420-dependent LLM class oxidoreductase [Actinomycetota bacterium]MDG2120651.1 TIGR03619 family F420-dependent LLM class oxidoreductase [Actinomycetota bacterium]
MKFGFVLPNNWGISDPNDVISLASEAEELGIDSIWVNHHIINIGYIAERLNERPYYDALTILNFVAARTEKISLGTSVLVLPYLHPMALAKSLATLDALSPKRVIAGLGVGGLPEENAALGTIYDGRGPWSDEFIEVMQILWSEGAANYQGQHFTMNDLIVGPKPTEQSIKIWIGGGGQLARERAAKFGNGWHPLATLNDFTQKIPKFEASLKNHSRDRADLTIAPRVEIESLPDLHSVKQWQDAGADQLIVNVGTSDLTRLREGLSHVAQLSSQAN